MAKRTSEKRSAETLEMADAIRKVEGDTEYPVRYTEDGIAARREQVWKFRARRVPQTVMADLLGVSKRTIASDVKWWKDQYQEHIEKIKKDPESASADIGLTAIRLEGMAQMAMNEAQLSNSGQTKNLFMNTAMKAEHSLADLKIKTGIWPKAGEDVRIRADISATFSAKLGIDSHLAVLDDPSSRRRVLSAAEKILKLTMRRTGGDLSGFSDDDLPLIILDEHQSDVIDVEGHVKDEE